MAQQEPKHPAEPGKPQTEPEQHKPATDSAAAELSDAQLDQVAGGLQELELAM